jgi:hypothetical protein
MEYISMLTLAVEFCFVTFHNCLSCSALMKHSRCSKEKVDAYIRIGTLISSPFGNNWSSFKGPNKFIIINMSMFEVAFD